MIGLLDVNVLIALAWPNHIHHAVAQRWFGQHQATGWATCPITQSAFVRISSNRKITPDAKSPQEALFLLRKITALPHHVFWIDETNLVDSKHVATGKLLGHRQVADAHLLAVALHHGGRLVTLDRGIREIVPNGLSASEAVVLLG